MWKDTETLKKALALYGVTDRACLPEGVTLTEAVRQAICGGATMIQIREKDLDRAARMDGDTGAEEALYKEAGEILSICREAGVPLIIDDNVALALQIGADGVHVGQQDMPAAEARRLLGPDRILGVTAKTTEQARKAEADGADYLGSGAVFGTSTKKDALPMQRETLEAITSAVAIPVVAIGGISVSNAEGLQGTGIAGIAVVSGIFGQKDAEAIRQAAETLSEIAGRL